jgi:hypothetical protein
MREISPYPAPETAWTDPEARSRDEGLTWCRGAGIMAREQADALEGFRTPFVAG